MTNPSALAISVALVGLVAVEVVDTNSPGNVAKFLVPDVIFGVGVLAEVGNAVRRQGGINVFVVSDHEVARPAGRPRRSGI